MCPTYDYDAFISYSREDSAWAEKLGDALRSKQIKAFIDRDRLEPGVNWRSQLTKSIQKSRHLIFLSSPAARSSDWVRDESARFRTIIDPSGEGPAGDRRLLTVLLHGEDNPLADLQMIDDVARAGAYDDGPEQMPAAVWLRVVDRIADAIVAAEGATTIPILLVTTTAARAAMIDPAHVPADAPSLEVLLGDLGLSPERFCESYGDTRRDWRPFGRDDSIDVILARLKDDLNYEISSATSDSGEGSPLLRWDYVAEEFWSETDTAARAMRRLRHGAAVVVVDPLSFYDELVASRYTNYVDEVFGNGAAFILVLSPFSLPANALALRNAIKQMARKVFSHFYTPPAFEGRTYARCGPSIGDPDEVRGWLTAALAAYVPLPEKRVPYLQVGPSRR